jgi:hypothetical protein
LRPDSQGFFIDLMFLVVYNDKMNRNILVLYAEGLCEEASDFLALVNNETKVDCLQVVDGWDAEFYTDLICIGFSLSPAKIEELYIAGYKQILTIDLYYDNHSLWALNVRKDKMPFLDHRGKWAILLADESWYYSTIRNLIKNET